MKLTEDRPYADPEKAARRIMEIARTVEPIQDRPDPRGEDQGPVPLSGQALVSEYRQGMMVCIERGWLVMHESGTFVRFTPAGADLFA